MIIVCVLQLDWGFETDRQKILLLRRQADRQTGRQADRQTDR